MMRVNDNKELTRELSDKCMYDNEAVGEEDCLNKKYIIILIR